MSETFDPIPPTKGWDFSTYSNWTQMDYWVNNIIAVEGADEGVTVEVIGTTYEGRNLYAFEIPATNPDYNEWKQGTIVIQCGLHAREWITPKFCEYFTHSVIWGSYQHLRENANIMILPLMNPDGYAYTFLGANERGWRKNRAGSDTLAESCIGVDLNRNTDARWEIGDGAALSQCSGAHTYRGTSVDSELETIARRDYMNSKFAEGGTNDREDIWIGVDAFLDIHSIGDMVYYIGATDYTNSELNHLPKPDDCNPDNPNQCFSTHREERQKEWAEQVFDSIKTDNTDKVVPLNTTKYPFFTVEPSSLLLTGAGVSGAADIWAYLRGAKFAATVELPPEACEAHNTCLSSCSTFDVECNSDSPGLMRKEPITDFECNFGTIAYPEAGSTYNQAGAADRYGDYYKKLKQFETKQYMGVVIGLTTDDLAALNETQNVPGEECWFACGALGGNSNVGICLDGTDDDNTECSYSVGEANEAGYTNSGHEIRQFCKFNYIGSNDMVNDGSDEYWGTYFSINADLAMPINSRYILAVESIYNMSYSGRGVDDNGGGGGGNGGSVVEESGSGLLITMILLALLSAFGGFFYWKRNNSKQQET